MMGLGVGYKILLYSMITSVYVRTGVLSYQQLMKMDCVAWWIFGDCKDELFKLLNVVNRHTVLKLIKCVNT